jgi:outer membrane protein OmpA-like peptidoglycan-associated protein
MHLRVNVAILALLSLARAGDAGPTGGAAGSVLVTPPDNPLQGGAAGVVRLGAKVARSVDLELEASRLEGLTRDLGILYVAWAPRMNMLFHVNPDSRADVYLGFGGGVQFVEVQRDSRADRPDANDRALYRNPSRDLLVTVGPGVTVHVAGPLHVRADARWYGTFGQDATATTPDTWSDAELVFGLDFRPEAPADRDRDGIPNRVDACVMEPEDRDGFEDDDGCPDGDNDGDGVYDGTDRCPEDAEDRDGFQDRDGCPDPDNDGDGVRDRRDSCPDEAEDGDGFEDDDGCPEDDNDKDAIPDARDRCPDRAEDKDGFADKDGCPDRDNDEDGLEDREDACANEPETVNGYQDGDGCPDEVPRAVRRFTGVIRGITFETNKDVIRPSSETTLEAALAVLLEYADVRLEVQGHTDDVGVDAFNLDLSQRRAEAVVRWFVARGVEAGRLRAVGYGETRPVAENVSDAGRAENRRVEFQLVQEPAEPLPDEMPAYEPAPDEPTPPRRTPPDGWEE